MIFFKSNKNELIYLRQYANYGSYSITEKIKCKSIDSIIKYFRKMIDIDDDSGVSIESKFNNLIYPVFDLDEKSQYELFKTLHEDTPYVIFMSSCDDDDEDPEYKYWGIVDTPYKKFKDLILNQNWKICNDSKYVRFSDSKGKILIRGLYETKKRKPTIFEKNGICSENFELFISKLEKYYNTNGFELSVLRHKDPELLIQFNRKLKLNKINCSEKESEF